MTVQLRIPTIKQISLIVILAFAVALVFSMSAVAETLVKQSVSQERPGLDLGAGSKLFRLFDPNLFQMRHSYSISYVSGGGGGQMLAMYLNQIDYQFAANASLHVGIGWLHQPQSVFAASGERSSGRILPSVRFDWRPSEKFHFLVSYETLSPFSYPYYYGQREYRRSVPDSLK